MDPRPTTGRRTLPLLLFLGAVLVYLYIDNTTRTAPPDALNAMPARPRIHASAPECLAGMHADTLAAALDADPTLSSLRASGVTGIIVSTAAMLPSADACELEYGTSRLGRLRDLGGRVASAGMSFGIAPVIVDPHGRPIAPHVDDFAAARRFFASLDGWRRACMEQLPDDARGMLVLDAGPLPQRSAGDELAALRLLREPGRRRILRMAHSLTEAHGWLFWNLVDAMILTQPARAEAWSPDAVRDSLLAFLQSPSAAGLPVIAAASDALPPARHHLSSLVLSTSEAQGGGPAAGFPVLISAIQEVRQVRGMMLSIDGIRNQGAGWIQNTLRQWQNTSSPAERRTPELRPTMP